MRYAMLAVGLVLAGCAGQPTPQQLAGPIPEAVLQRDLRACVARAAGDQKTIAICECGAAEHRERVTYGEAYREAVIQAENLRRFPNDPGRWYDGLPRATEILHLCRERAGS